MKEFGTIMLIIFGAIGLLVVTSGILYALDNNTLKDKIEYGLILNPDYTITIIDLESDEIVATATSDNLGQVINDLQL